MDFNNKLINKYKQIDTYFNIIDIYRKNKKYIISMYNDNDLLLRGEYIIIGSYSKIKNFWIWADQSFTLDKSMVYLVSDIRKKLLKEKISSTFVKNNYTVITTSEIKNNCKILDSKLKGNLYFNESDDIIDLILITKIMQNNIN